MQAFFENVCSATAAASTPSPMPAPFAWPRPLTVHTPASYLANVCSWHSITNISFGSPCKYGGDFGSFSQRARKSMLQFCVPRGEARLICVLPSLTLSFGHVILKSISNRVAPPPPSPPLPSYFCMKITNLLSKKEGVGVGTTLLG